MLEGLLMLLGGLALIVLAIFYGALTHGLVLWKFWYWFLLPVFPALPVVTFIQCVGLMVFIGLFRHADSQVIKKEYKDEALSNTIPIILPWIVLGIGYFVHVFIVK
jgi:hypothetical protein